MSKTIKEWLLSIEDPEIRNRALNNMDDKDRDRIVESLEKAIRNGFDWQLTPEGYEYWDKFSEMEITLLKIITPEEFYNDPINPDHYKNAVETIDAIEASMTPEAFRGYLKGNVIKYVTRYEKKNGVEDLKKADWYLSKLINTFASE
jgi:hypothetical protein